LKEPEILKRRGDRRLLRPVWVATQGLDLKHSPYAWHVFEKARRVQRGKAFLLC